MANNDLGSLSFGMNIDLSQLPSTIKDVEKQLSTINTVVNTDIRTDPTQIINAIKQALMAEDFKLKVSLDESFKGALSNATSILNRASTGTGGSELAQLGYIDSLIAKLKELEAQYKALPKGADTSALVNEFRSVQTELDKAGKNLSSAFGKSFADINKMAETTIGEVKAKIRTLEQFKLNIPLTDQGELKKINDLINKLKGDISNLFPTQQVNPFALPEASIREIEIKIKALKEIKDFSPINSQEFIKADAAITGLRDKLASIGKLNWGQAFALPEQSLEEIKRKIKEIEGLKVKSPIDSTHFKDATKELERLQKLLADTTNPPKAQRTFAEVMGMDTNTLNQITEKLNEIRRIRSEINASSPNGMSQINSLNRSEADLLRIQQQRLGVNKQINESYSEQSKLVDSLASKALAYFSLQKMEQFASKLVEIRGEFEKQQVALQVILQSKDQADKLFSQVVDLGLKSPFSIMQLNSYVKGLAAYRIETDQLFDTTKRLADISSGLGVDMGRLILAYGQVRAASVLRGQEVRQFTEAGIPLIEALADQFTKLEGRVVSTNEVFDKISNRLVPFEMVRDVLFEMTDAGGVFFNMQEKQAETLGAKWKNLQDAIDVMYNSIGQDKQGFLKGVAEGLTALTENWRGILGYMESGVATLVIYKALALSTGSNVAKLATSTLAWHRGSEEAARRFIVSQNGISGGFTRMGLSARGMAASFKSFLATNGWILLAAAIVGISYKLYDAYKESKRFGKELTNIANSGADEAEALIKAHDELKKSIEGATEGTIARKEAIDKLNTQFGAYYSNTLTDINAQQMLANEYEKVNAAIREKSRLTAMEKANTLIEEEYGSKMNDKITSLLKTATKSQVATDASLGTTTYFDAINKEDMSEFLKRFRDTLSKTQVEAKDVAALVEKIAKDYGLSANNSARLGTYLLSDLKDLAELNNGANKALSEASDVIDTRFKTSGTLAKQQFEGYKSELSTIETVLDNIKAANRVVYTNENEYIEQNRLASEKAAEQKIELSKKYSSYQIEDHKAELKRIQVTSSRIKDAVMATEGYGGKYFKYFSSFTDSKSMQDAFKDQKDIVADVTKSNVAIAEAKSTMAAMQKLADKLGVDLDPKASKKEDRAAAKAAREAEDARLKQYKAEIALIEQANKDYTRYLKNLDAINAKKEISDDYVEQFKALGVDIKYASDKLEYYKKLREELAKDKSVKGKQLFNDVNKEIPGTKTELKQEDLDKYWSDLTNFFDLKKEAYALRDQYMLKGLDKGTAELFVKSIFKEIPIKFDSFDKEVTSKLSDSTGNWGSESGKAFVQKFGYEAKNAYLDLLDKFQTTQQKINGVNFKYTQIFEALAAQRSSVSSKEYEEMVTNAQKAKEEELSVITSSLLQMTDAYQKMFGDISEMSEKELSLLIERWKNAIEQARKNLDGTFTLSIDGGDYRVTEKQISSFTQKIIKSEKELRSKNPFKALKDSFKDLQNNRNEIKDIQDKIEALTKARGSMKSKESVDELNKVIDQHKDKLKSLEAVSATKWANISNQIGNVSSKVTELGSAFISLFESLGADEDTTNTLNDIMGIVGGIGDAASGIARMQSGDIIGGLTQSIKGIAGVISSITSLSDRKHEKEIKKLQKAIDESSRAYERLGRAASKALGNATYDAQKAQIAELKRQQTLIQGQIKAEKNKKKTDKDKVSSWEKEIEQLGYEIEDIVTGITESLTGSIKSMADEMTSALVDAFEAGDDAQAAMFKSIKNNLKQVIAEQFQKSVVESMLKPLMDNMDSMLGISSSVEAITAQEEKIAALEKQRDTSWIVYRGKKIDVLSKAEREAMDKAIEQAKAQLEELKKGDGNYKFTPEQVKELVSQAGNISQDILDAFESGGWKEIFDALNTSDTLSGLGQGIQGLTEDTAQILEAYLNTIRQVVISIMMVQENQLTVLEGSQLIQSQILNEVSAINTNTVAIANAIQSVITYANGVGGAGFRVYLQ